MLFGSLFAFFLLTSSAFSGPTAPIAIERCGQHQPSEKELRDFDEPMKKYQNVPAEKLPKAPIAKIEIWAHVAYKNNTFAGGYATDEMIDDNIEIINKAFEPTGFSFVKIGTTRTLNEAWFIGPALNGDPTEIAMKKALRQGDYNTLNVYFTGLKRASPLGWATFPLSKKPPPDSAAFIRDGLIIKTSSLPVGPPGNYNQGHTLTHETGHWLGLFHTFQGGCNEASGGDYVADTPWESYPSYYCEPMDSCPQPGTDPINNYMDYGYDWCMTEWSPGQINRMAGIWPWRE